MSSSPATATLRKAASVLVVSPASPAPPCGIHTYRLLFMKRSSKSAFMPSRHVFPGGGVEPGDACDRAAALRELAEETGLRLAASPSAPGRCAQADSPRPHVSAVARLVPWARWVTPRAVRPRRYDTASFVAALDAHPAAGVAADMAEAESVAWLCPCEALGGDASLAPPQVYILHEIMGLATPGDVLRAAAARPAETWQPTMAAGPAVLLPDDPGHDAADLEVPGAPPRREVRAHRVVRDHAAGRWRVVATGHRALQPARAKM